MPCPLQGDLSDPGIEPMSPALQAVSLPSEPTGKPNLYKGVSKRNIHIFNKKKKSVVKVS